MKLSEIRHILTEHHLTLTRSMGQNFMHDGNQLRRIVDAAELVPGDQVLEIGPGLGPLTELLVSRAHEVLAIEKDRRLVALLSERLGHRSNLRIVHGDAVDYVEDRSMDWSQWKLVSNLPYSVASRILVCLAGMEQGPARMVATLQREVAQRILSQAGAPDYGLLSLLLQLNYVPLQHFKIPAACFFPQPDVDSACIALERRPGALLELSSQPVFVRLVKRAFSQRRKVMFKLLKEDWKPEKLDAAYHTVNLDLKVRAETVSLTEFVALTQCLIQAD